MADDKTKKRLDRTRINIHEPYEVNYWCNKLSLTPEMLKELVKKVGTSVKNVETELNRR